MDLAKVRNRTQGSSDVDPRSLRSIVVFVDGSVPSGQVDVPVVHSGIMNFEGRLICHRDGYSKHSPSNLRTAVL